MTGLQCAGCGTGRGVHHLLQGDFSTAWRFNPLMVLLGLPAAIIIAMGELTVLSVGRRLRLLAVPPWMGWGLVFVVVAWWIGRNV